MLIHHIKLTDIMRIEMKLLEYLLYRLYFLRYALDVIQNYGSRAGNHEKVVKL